MLFRICISLLLLAGIDAHTAGQVSNCIPVKTVREADVAYRAGEKLDFTIHYTFGILDSDIGVATVTLDTLRMGGVKVFHCRVFGKTTKLYDKFFPVREDFNSWFTCDGLRPVRFTRNTSENKYKAENEYIYMWDAQNPHIDAKVFTTNLNATKVLNVPLKECVFDLPSLFFFARNIDMSRVKQDVTYPMTFAIDDDVYDVHFIYRGKETKKVRGFGTVKCLKFEADLLEGEVFKGDSDMELFITDDDNRLPVLFGAPILVGEVEGRMSACSGLKYPLSSKIK